MAPKKDSLLRALEGHAKEMRFESMVAMQMERIRTILSEYSQADGVEDLAETIARSAPETGVSLLGGMLAGDDVRARITQWSSRAGCDSS